MIKEIFELMRLFPDSFINYNNELILDRKENIFFRLEGVETVEELKRKIISWLSRTAAKGPYKKTREKFRANINRFLNKEWEEEDFKLVYTYLGNDCNGELCKNFVKHDCDIKWLIEELKKTYGEIYNSKGEIYE